MAKEKQTALEPDNTAGATPASAPSNSMETGRDNTAGVPLEGPKPKSTVSSINNEIMNRFVDGFVKALENGGGPWQKPWKGTSLMPHNPVTGTHYRGINRFMLGFEAIDKGYSSSQWVTANNVRAMAEKMKAENPNLTPDQLPHIKKGSKASEVMFTQVKEVVGKGKKKDQETGEEQDVVFNKVIHKTFHVFNADQIANYPLAKQSAKEFEPVENIEQLLQAFQKTGLTIAHGGDAAFYSPQRDHMQLPPKLAFKSEEHYYDTALHEAMHATMHASRMNRTEAYPARFGDANYAIEEFRAQTASMICSAMLGIDHSPELMQNHTSYVTHWVQEIKTNPKLLFKELGNAERIADYGLNLRLEYLKSMEQNQQATQTQAVQQAPVANTKVDLSVPAVKNTIYTGVVVDITDERIVQKVGAKHIAHDRADLPEMPNLQKGTRVQVDYRAFDAAKGVKARMQEQTQSLNR